MKKISTHFLILILILGIVGILNSFWVFLNYSSVSDAYSNVTDDYQEIVIKYTREIASKIDVDTINLGEKHSNSSDYELLMEPYYTNGNRIYLRKNNNFYEYRGKNLKRLEQLAYYKHELQDGKVDQTVTWLQSMFGITTALILLLSYLIYRFYTKKFRENIDQLMLAIKTPEMDGKYDFIELDHIQKAMRKYHIISTQIEKQNMAVDLMTNWKLEIRKLIHDLKNPIQRLLLNVSNQPNSEAAIVSINEINQKLKELRSNDGSDDVTPVEINISRFFERLIPLFYDIKITVTNRLNTPFIFDEFGFQRITSNLIQNALEAGATDVTFNFYNEGHIVLCDIINNGKMIEIPDKLFVPFATTKKNGTGLGLVIMLQIVHAHKGQFFLKHTNETNTIFTIQLNKS